MVRVSSRECVISRPVTGRAAAASTVATAAVLPSSVVNSTSKAFPSAYTWTTVPTSPTSRPSEGTGSVSTMRSCSLITLIIQPPVNNPFLAVHRFRAADDLPCSATSRSAFTRRSGSSRKKPRRSKATWITHLRKHLDRYRRSELGRPLGAASSLHPRVRSVLPHVSGWNGNGCHEGEHDEQSRTANEGMPGSLPPRMDQPVVPGSLWQRLDKRNRGRLLSYCCD